MYFSFEFLIFCSYLIKSWDWALQGKALVPTLSYLSKFVKRKTNQRWDPSYTGIIDGLQSVAAKYVRYTIFVKNSYHRNRNEKLHFIFVCELFSKLRLAYQHIEERKKKGLTYEHAANATAIELVQCAESHCRAFLVSSAFEMTKDIDKKLSPQLALVIHQLIELYALDTCMKSLADLIRVRLFFLTKIRKYAETNDNIHFSPSFYSILAIVYYYNGKGNTTIARSIGAIICFDSTECRWNC